MRLPGEERIALESELRRALERGEIEVQYQPIVGTTDGIAAGFEALLRWRHPVHGLLTADSFVSIAEETGIIVALGRYVLEQAARQLAVWNRIAPVFVSVNISPRQMMRADFPRLCEAALETPGLAPGSLKFEVTENLVMENPEAASRLLARLKALGAGLAIDDFGVGHSTLQRLSGLPFDTIKIDKSFLTGPGADRALVSGLWRWRARWD